jgi:hypothetical protein
VSSEEQDGYRIARVEFDEPPPSPAQQAAAAAATAAAAAAAPAEQAPPPPSVTVSALPGMEAAGGSSSGAGSSGAQAPPPAPPDDDPALLASLASRADVLATTWIERLRACGGVRHAEYLARAGARPPARDAPALAWWIANLLPVPSGERYALLAAPSDAQRLRRELELMNADGGACAVM